MTTAIRDHLRRIYEQAGTLTPAGVVDVARAADHPLHSSFEWDDSIAGERYRLVQARELIRCTVIDADPTPADKGGKVRAFVSVNRVDGPTYVPTEIAAQDDLMRAIVLQGAEREWRTLQRKYAHLAEFMDMVRRDLAA